MVQAGKLINDELQVYMSLYEFIYSLNAIDTILFRIQEDWFDLEHSESTFQHHLATFSPWNSWHLLTLKLHFCTSYTSYSLAWGSFFMATSSHELLLQSAVDDWSIQAAVPWRGDSSMSWRSRDVFVVGTWLHRGRRTSPPFRSPSWPSCAEGLPEIGGKLMNDDFGKFFLICQSDVSIV